MRLTLWALLVSTTVATTTAATAQDSTSLAIDLGSVLASEEPCGLAYAPAAIEVWILENVAEDDMGFTSTLNLMTSGSAYEIAEMTPSQKTAHCAQIARVARSFGFTG